MNEKQHLICRKPFESLELSDFNHRSAFACCPGWVTIPLGASIDLEGNSRISNDNKVWNSRTAKWLRKSVLDGSFSYCNKIHCPHLNTVSGPVGYVDDNVYKRYMDFATSDNPESMLYPKQLNCAYDRSCNLACPSCRKDVIGSTKAEKEADLIYIESVLETYGEHLEEITITGSGDAFGSAHYWDLLRGDFLLKYPNLKIRLHTNALLLTERRWSQISHLHDRIISIEISIDAATKETYEINRFPGKWNVLTQNMDFIADLKQQGVFPTTKLSFVVQNNNWKEMKEFIALADNWNADIINFTPLNNWGTFTENEYLQRAVHLKTNRNYHLFKAYTASSCFDKNKIEMGFLSVLDKVSSKSINKTKVADRGCISYFEVF